MKLIIFLLISFLIVNNISAWGFGGGNDNNKGPNKDLYKLLEISKKASKEEIKKQYRKLQDNIIQIKILNQKNYLLKLLRHMKYYQILKKEEFMIQKVIKQRNHITQIKKIMKWIYLVFSEEEKEKIKWII